jgi:tetratricopeptide (TPR) repeat protein
VQLFDRGDYPGAENFLTAASNPKAPEQTDPAVWQHLAKTRIQLKKYQGAVQASDFFLASVDSNAARARALLDKSIALSGLKKFKEATVTAEEALNLEKQGRVNALARLQLGDVAMDEGLHDQALKHYTVVSQIFIDPQITPLALEKAATAHEKAGNAEKAAELRAQRKQKFPEYQPAPAPSLKDEPDTDTDTEKTAPS